VHRRNKKCNRTGARTIARALLSWYVLPATFGLLSISTVQAAPGDLLLTLRPPDLAPFTKFGDALGVVGGNIIVGAPDTHLLDDGLAFVGQAHVFDGTTGDLLYSIPHPDPQDRSVFGSAVLGFEDRILIGAPGQDVPNEFGDGAVYVFDSADGALLKTIPNPNQSGFGSRFGHNLAAAGSKTLTGQSSRFLPTGGRGPIGSVYLFDPVTGLIEPEILNPALGDGEGDLFSAGNGVASLGGRPVVGATHADIPEQDGSAGRVYVFDDLTGELLLAIDNPEPTSANLSFIPDWFGFAVAATDEKIFVGARLDDPHGVEDAGIVYSFDGSTGELLLTIEPPDPWRRGEFGKSLAVVGDNILVGAYDTPADGMEHAGKAYLFDGATGELLLEIPNPEPGPDFFGWQLASFGNDILVSAIADAVDGAPGHGTVYLFEGVVPEPQTISLACSGLIVVAFFVCDRGRRRDRRLEKTRRRGLVD